MVIGMPIIVRDFYDFPLVIRNRIDGFSKWDDGELIKIVRELLLDKNKAMEWGEKAKLRAEEFFSLEKEREVFTKAFEDAIKMH
jgi:glycosyltransferase involved in cell wall biosynthesis